MIHSSPSLTAVVRRAAKDLRATVAEEAGPQEAYEKAQAEYRRVGEAVNGARRAFNAATRTHAGNPSPAAKAALSKAKADLEALRKKWQEAGKVAYSARIGVIQIQRKAHAILTARHARLAGSQSVQQRMESVLNSIKDNPPVAADRQR